jgi:hypothetical protein
MKNNGQGRRLFSEESVTKKQKFNNIDNSVKPAAPIDDWSDDEVSSGPGRNGGYGRGSGRGSGPLRGGRNNYEGGRGRGNAFSDGRRNDRDMNFASRNG